IADEASKTKPDQGEPDDVESPARNPRRSRTRSENEKQRPDNADDNPRRLVMNDAIGREDPDAINGEIANDKVPKELTRQTENQSNIDWPFVAHHEFEPVRPWLFVSVAVRTSLIPSSKCQVESFHAWPIEKCAGIKKDDEKDDCTRHHDK